MRVGIVGNYVIFKICMMGMGYAVMFHESMFFLIETVILHTWFQFPPKLCLVTLLGYSVSAKDGKLLVSVKQRLCRFIIFSVCSSIYMYIYIVTCHTQLLIYCI